MTDPRAQALLDFVRRNLDDPNVEVTVDTPLLSDKLVDSMGLTMLAAFVEEEFQVPFDGTELRAGGPESIRALLEIIAARA